MKKILLIHQGALGDLILSLPAFYAIRNKYQEACFEVMGYPRVLRLIHNRFYAHEIVSVDRAGVSSLYNYEGGLNEELQNYFRQLETVFIFGGQSQAVVIKNIQQIKDGPDVYFVKTFPDSPDMHVTDFQLQQLALLGFVQADNVPEIYLCDEDINKSQHFLRDQSVDLDKPFIAVHPGSGSKAKNWPLDNFAFFIKSFYQKCGGTVLIVEGPAEQNMIHAMRTALNDIPLIDLQCLDLPLLAAVLSQCSLFVGNDSGITHLAAAVGVPTIALFGPTDPAVWGPRGKNVYIAREGSEAHMGWKWVSTDAVLKAALDLFNQH